MLMEEGKKVRIFLCFFLFYFILLSVCLLGKFNDEISSTVVRNILDGLLCKSVLGVHDSCN